MNLLVVFLFESFIDICCGNDAIFDQGGLTSQVNDLKMFAFCIEKKIMIKKEFKKMLPTYPIFLSM